MCSPMYGRVLLFFFPLLRKSNYEAKNTNANLSTRPFPTHELHPSSNLLSETIFVHIKHHFNSSCATEAPS